MLSPKDHRWIDRWYRAGIPSDVVVEAINTAFENPPVRRIHSLSFVAQSVEHAAKAWRTRQTGSSLDGVDSETEWSSAIDDLIQRLKRSMLRHSEPEIIDVLDGTSHALESIRSRWQSEPNYDLGAALDHLERQTLDLALKAMPAIARIELEHGVEAALQGQPNMQPSVYAETRDAFTHRRIRTYLDLPAFEVKVDGGW